MTDNKDLRRIQEYLASHNTMTLASSGGEGPWAAAVFYASDADLNLYFKSDSRTRHMADIANNPSVAATVQDDGQAWQSIRGLQLLGTCGWVDGSDAARVDQLYKNKFPFLLELDNQPADDNERILAERLGQTPYARLSLQWIRFIDNERGFGHKVEIRRD